MSNVVALFFFFGIVTEFVLSLMWFPGYFRVGIPLFYMRVSVDEGFAVSRILPPSKRAETLLDNCGFSVKQISLNEIAIRERFFVFSRGATLHGLIRFSPDRNEVIALGFINWSLLFFIGIIALMLSPFPAPAWLIVIVIILASIGSNIIKFKTYVKLTTQSETFAAG